MNNRIELLLKASLSKDSLKDVRKQVKKLQKSLDTLELDKGLIKSLKQLQKMDIGQGQFKEMRKELEAAQKELDKLNEKAKKSSKETQFGGFKLDENTILKDFESLKKEIEKRGGSVKFELDTKGAKTEITKLSAEFDRFGEKVTETFRKQSQGGKDYWDVSRINIHDSYVKDTTKSYDKLSEAIAKAGKDGNITQEQMKKFNSELERSKGSQGSIERLSESLDSVVTSSKNLNRLTTQLEKLRSEGKISNEIFQEQKKILSDIGNLDNKAYREMTQQVKLIVVEEKERAKAVKESEREVKNLERAYLELERMQTKLIKAENYRPKIKSDEDFNKTVDKLNDLNFNKAKMSAKELETELAKVNSSIDRMSAKATEAGRTQIGIIDSFKIALEKFPVWVATSTMFYGSIRSAKEFMTIIIDVDTKMTELRKVMSDDTDFGAVFDDAKRSAEEFGMTIRETMDAYIEFAKQGYEGADLKFLADAAVVASNVTELDSGKSAEYITATLIQWKKEASEAMDVLDKFNEIGNNFAVTASQLMEGQAKSASVANTMGMSFEELNGILAVTIEATKQSGSEIG